MNIRKTYFEEQPLSRWEYVLKKHGYTMSSLMRKNGPKSSAYILINNKTGGHIILSGTIDNINAAGDITDGIPAKHSFTNPTDLDVYLKELHS